MRTNPISQCLCALAIAAAVPLVVAQTSPFEDIVPKPASEKSEDMTKKGTLMDTIHGNLTFSILSKALKAADLEATLSGAESYTLFAPTDEAFGKLPAGTLDKLMLPENKEKLRSLLLYHLVPGQTPSFALKDDSTVKTANGEELKIDIDLGKVKVEDAKTLSVDLMVDNGVFHSIDMVLVPKSLDGFEGLKH